jgi:hypothetical protein
LCYPAIRTPRDRASTAQGKRKKRGAYQGERRRIEYQDGLPVIDPDGEEDRIFRYIADHRDAVAHYDRCVDVEDKAEGKVSGDEIAHLQRKRVARVFKSRGLDEMVAGTQDRETPS